MDTVNVFTLLSSHNTDHNNEASLSHCVHCLYYATLMAATIISPLDTTIYVISSSDLCCLFMQEDNI